MALNSMTGFARQSGECDGFLFNWEAKSVNGKGLDVRCRVPSLLDGFDVKVRKSASAMFSRGSLFLNLELVSAEQRGLSIDETRLEALVSLAGRYEGRPGIAPARLDGLLAIKGVLDASDSRLDEAARHSLETGLMAGLNQVLAALQAARREEGAALEPVIQGQIDDIAGHIEAAEATAGAQPDAIRNRITAKLEELLSEHNKLEPARLEQEIAVLALRHDVREELDRLREHVKQAQTLMASGQPVGRKFDFLAQEFNREANTLCSKSADKQLTAIGLALKATIDQLREQIQNVE